MDILKKVFPFSFNTKENDATSLIVSAIIYVVIAVIGGLLLGLLSQVPFIGFVFGLVGGVIDTYALVGIVLALLRFFGVLK